MVRLLEWRTLYAFATNPLNFSLNSSRISSRSFLSIFGISQWPLTPASRVRSSPRYKPGWNLVSARFLSVLWFRQIEGWVL